MARTVLLAASLLAAAPACAQSAGEAAWPPTSPDRQVRVTAPQLLAAAEKMVAAHNWIAAQPLVIALNMAPGYRKQSRYLSGLIAASTGDLRGAANDFETVLAEDPRQTRVRLALAQVLLAMKQPASADRQFRIAAQNKDLSPEVARTIRTMRDTIRASRAWRLELDVGIAPDTNISGATGAQTVTVLLGGQPIPLDLDKDGRARSGVGVTGRISAGLRLPVGHGFSALAEFDGVGTEYRGSTFDDYLTQLAAGAEYRLSAATSASLEGVGAIRWFGGHTITRQVGARTGVQTAINGRNRFGVDLDVRRTTALFDAGYSGWQGGLYTTYEHAIGRAVVVSFGPFVRRDWLREHAYSNTELGGTVGIGGELPHGITFGASVSRSRASYDEPMWLFDAKPRHDDRTTVRATLGDRQIRVFGLSPQVSWCYTRNASTLGLYDTRRSRVELTVARYF